MKQKQRFISFLLAWLMVATFGYAIACLNFRTIKKTHTSTGSPCSSMKTRGLCGGVGAAYEARCSLWRSRGRPAWASQPPAPSPRPRVAAAPTPVGDPTKRT